jgi:hypothetical protein
MLMTRWAPQLQAGRSRDAKAVGCLATQSGELGCLPAIIRELEDDEA